MRESSRVRVKRTQHWQLRSAVALGIHRIAANIAYHAEYTCRIPAQTMALSNWGYFTKFDINVQSTFTSGSKVVILYIFQASSILTDGILEAIAPSLVNLEHLNLTGCPKVTHHGVWAIVSSSTIGIVGLALEGVWHRFVSYPSTFFLSFFIDLTFGF